MILVHTRIAALGIVPTLSHVRVLTTPVDIIIIIILLLERTQSIIQQLRVYDIILLYPKISKPVPSPLYLLISMGKGIVIYTV